MCPDKPYSVRMPIRRRKKQLKITIALHVFLFSFTFTQCTQTHPGRFFPSRHTLNTTQDLDQIRRLDCKKEKGDKKRNPVLHSVSLFSSFYGLKIKKLHQNNQGVKKSKTRKAKGLLVMVNEDHMPTFTGSCILWSFG